MYLSVVNMVAKIIYTEYLRETLNPELLIYIWQDEDELAKLCWLCKKDNAYKFAISLLKEKDVKLAICCLQSSWDCLRYISLAVINKPECITLVEYYIK